VRSSKLDLIMRRLELHSSMLLGGDGFNTNCGFPKKILRRKDRLIFR
jgi:hypothetical protein